MSHITIIVNNAIFVSENMPSVGVAAKVVIWYEERKEGRKKR